MKILHIVPGLEERWNGMAVAARMIAEGQRREGNVVELVEAGGGEGVVCRGGEGVVCRGREEGVECRGRGRGECDEVWVHGMWTPMVWRACWGVIREKKVEVKGEGGQRNARKVKLVRMVHANLDPVRYRFHGWKKRLVAPMERWLFRRTDEVVVTCEVEKEWCEAWGLKNEFRVVDLKRFFNLECLSGARCSSLMEVSQSAVGSAQTVLRGVVPGALRSQQSVTSHSPHRNASHQAETLRRQRSAPSSCALPAASCDNQSFARSSRPLQATNWPNNASEMSSIKTSLGEISEGEGNHQASNPLTLQASKHPLHVLYLGRRHPLKGVEYLERAVEEVNRKISKSQNRQIDLRVVSDAFGEEKERVWEWCEVLVLPTLSENFGLVVAEALERGKRVITTDGAPVWEGQEGVVYLKGFRDGTRELRVRLLKEAIEKFLRF